MLSQIVIAIKNSLVTKLLGIVVLSLLWFSNVYALTLYCDHPKWRNFMTLKVDLESNTIQDMDEEEVYEAKISEKFISFGRDTWHSLVISRISGKFTRTIINSSPDNPSRFEQSGTCSTEKPSYKKKF